VLYKIEVLYIICQMWKRWRSWDIFHHTQYDKSLSVSKRSYCLLLLLLCVLLKF